MLRATEQAAQEPDMHAIATPPTALAAQVRGSGPRMVCLHSSTGSSAQWRALQDAMASRWEVLAPDLHGHGRSPGWPDVAGSALEVDADAVSALAGIDQRPVHLVGHSYGAAVALELALRHPRQVRSLTLYEPVVFGLIGQAAPADPALAEIEEIAASVAALVAAGADVDAARVFVGYWGGPRAWSALADDQKRAVAQRMRSVPRHFDAIFATGWDASALASLRMPVLLMHGSATRASARRATELLGAALPQAQAVELAGAGHLGPLTHAETVVRWIVTHLDPRLAAQRSRLACRSEA
jgi:pimeloyl-ACP methyl ester carboxylesterase